MDIIAKDFKDLISKAEFLDNESTIRLDVSRDCLKYSIIIKNAQCNLAGNLMMFVNGVVKITIIGLDLLHNQINIPIEMLEYYLNLLSKSNYTNVLKSTILLMRNQLRIDDVIEFNNGKVGIIINPEIKHNGQIYYRLLKKNGELGVKEFVLYGRTKEYNYKCKDREFKDYSTL